MQIGINLQSGQGHERSTSGVRKSKIKVTGGQSYVWKPGGDIILGALSLVEPLIETSSVRRKRCL